MEILSGGQMVQESHMAGDTGSTGEGEFVHFCTGIFFEPTVQTDNHDRAMCKVTIFTVQY